jgi:hypothetical protein
MLCREYCRRREVGDFVLTVFFGRSPKCRITRLVKMKIGELPPAKEIGVHNPARSRHPSGLVEGNEVVQHSKENTVTSSIAERRM